MFNFVKPAAIMAALASPTAAFADTAVIDVYPFSSSTEDPSYLRSIWNVRDKEECIDTARFTSEITGALVKATCLSHGPKAIVVECLPLNGTAICTTSEKTFRQPS